MSQSPQSLHLAITWLLTACPYDQKQPADCPVFADMRKKPLADRVAWARMLTLEGANEIWCRHKQCLRAREQRAAAG